MSAARRHSEDELREQWAFLDTLVERQASTLRAGVQDPDEEELELAAAQVEATRADEITVLRRRIDALEAERAQLLRRLDLTEQARVAAEDARASAEASRAIAATPAAGSSRIRSWWRRLSG